MSTIVLRATKGSPLTNNEIDSNFSNLNTDKLQMFLHIRLLIYQVMPHYLGLLLQALLLQTQPLMVVMLLLTALNLTA